MKALSLFVQKLWSRLSLLWTDRQADRQGDSSISPNYVCGGGGGGGVELMYISIYTNYDVTHDIQCMLDIITFVISPI